MSEYKVRVSIHVWYAQHTQQQLYMQHTANHQPVRSAETVPCGEHAGSGPVRGGETTRVHFYTRVLSAERVIRDRLIHRGAVCVWPELHVHAHVHVQVHGHGVHVTCTCP
jgi:hypothetical protein